MSNVFVTAVEEELNIKFLNSVEVSDHWHLTERLGLPIVFDSKNECYNVEQSSYVSCH